jgi:UDP-2,3-diacylglucosamine pyrophosphatase LpxH
MKSTHQHLTDLFHNAPRIPFNNRSRLIFLSDVHRGDSSWADDFVHNEVLFGHALQHYYHKGFTYIEVGDGDELLKHHRFEDIRQAHISIFNLLQCFHQEGRLHLLFGNHDIFREDPDVVAQELHWTKDLYTGQLEPFLPGIEVHEGLVFYHSETGGEFFVLHGHQADFWEIYLKNFVQFLVRRLWRPFQLLGIHDPTSASQNIQKRGKIEDVLTGWVTAQSQPVICGHTHRAVFPINGNPPYFNTGGCTNPRWITGLEIDRGSILLVRWRIQPGQDGVLRVQRDILAGPRPLTDFFPQPISPVKYPLPYPAPGDFNENRHRLPTNGIWFN